MTTAQKQHRIRVTYSGNSVGGQWTSDADICVEIGDEIAMEPLPRGWFAEDAIEFGDDELSDVTGCDGTLTEVGLLTWAVRKFGAIREAVGLPVDTDWTPFERKQIEFCDEDDLRYFVECVRRTFGDASGDAQAAALDA